MSTLLNKNVIIHYLPSENLPMSGLSYRVELYKQNCISNLTGNTDYVNIYLPTSEQALKSGVYVNTNAILTNTGNSYNFLAVHHFKLPYNCVDETETLNQMTEYKTNFYQFQSYTDVIEICVPTFSNSNKTGLDIIPLINN